MKIANAKLLALMVLTVSLLLANVAAVLSAPDYRGTWSGKTSQDHPVWLQIADVGGRQTVTGVKFNILVKGSAYSVTITLLLPHKTSSVIESQGFRAEWEESDESYVITGKFESATSVSGTIKVQHVHPQGYGTATGDATFIASKEAAR